MFSGKTKNKKDRFNRLEDINPTEMDPRYKWYNLIHIFIKELNMKVDEVYEMNYISGLNWLSFFKNRNEVENNRNKQ